MAAAENKNALAVLRVTGEQAAKYDTLFSSTLVKEMRFKFLSHLVSTIEDLINAKRKATASSTIADLVDKRALRLFSIRLTPCRMARRSTVRYYDFGLSIIYNPDNDGKDIRIAIAHELGHIVNKKIFELPIDDEDTANYFAYVVMKDKNEFYKSGSKDFTFPTNPAILDRINVLFP